MAIFDTSDIETTGLSVTGRVIVSGNSATSLLTMSGASNIILTVNDLTGSSNLLTVATIGGTNILTVTTAGTLSTLFTTSGAGSAFLGPLSGSNITGITVVGTTLTTSGAGSAFLGPLSGSNITGITIVGNTFTTSGAGSAFLGPLSGSNITGNTFVASGPASVFLGPHSGSNITGITIVAAGASSSFSGSLSGSNITGITISAASITSGPGTTTLQPFKIATGGTLLTTAVAGSLEADSSVTPYFTTDINGRSLVRTEQFVFLTGTTPLINSAAAQRLFTGTTFSSGAVIVKANTSYSFETAFDLSGMSATLGTFSFGFSGTASIASCRYNAMSIKNTLASATTFDTQIIVRASGLTPVSSATTGTVGGTFISGTLRIGGVGGTLAPITALSTAAAAIVAQDSYFKITPIGDTKVVIIGNWV